MNPLLAEDYRAGLRALLAEKGRVVRVNRAQVEKYPHRPETWASSFGWEDDEAQAHVRAPSEQELAWYGDEAHTTYESCGLVVPEGAQLYEVVYSDFDGTDYPHIDTLGINCFGSVSCKCGKFSDLTVRWEGSLSDALRSLLGRERLITFTL